MKISEHNEKVLTQFANMIIERMQQMKAENWRKGWVGRTYGTTPMNIEHKNYHGGNVFWLMMHCAMNSYTMPVYCTLRQANSLGARIKKGEKSMPVIFWDFDIRDANGRRITMDDYKKMSNMMKDKCTCRPFLKSYQVFNVDQTDLAEKCPDLINSFKNTYDLDQPADDNGMYSNKLVDDMLHEQSWLCPIEYERFSDGAFYSNSTDTVVVPMKKQFKTGTTPEEIFTDGQEFYATLLHELVHSTGTEDRLNRNLRNRFGDKLYAKEELIAELGAARVGQVLGFDKRIFDNNAAYLDGWISSLKAQPTFVLTLMGDVEKASQMILEKLTA